MMLPLVLKVNEEVRKERDNLLRIKQLQEKGAELEARAEAAGARTSTRR